MSNDASRIAAAAQSQLNGRTVGRNMTSRKPTITKDSESIRDTLETGDRQSTGNYIQQDTAESEHSPLSDSETDSSSSGDILDITG